VITLSFINEIEMEPPTVQSRVGSHRAEERISDAFSPETYATPVNSLQTVIGTITTPNMASPVMNQLDYLRSVPVQ